jgi:26S proteasome regulatory subunit N5
MDKQEKTDFILEQVRLCLDTDDPIRAQILSNKINRKYLNADDTQV